jgi:hypothetical protein
MLCKKFYLILFVGVLVLPMLSCGSGSSGPSGSGPSQETAVIIAQCAMDAVSSAFDQATDSKKNITKGNEKYTHTGSGWTADVTFTYDDSNVTPYIYDLEFSWSDYSYTNTNTGKTITLSDGTTSFIEDIKSINDIKYTYSGDFDVSYNGTTYNFSWNLIYAFTTSASYTGTFTIDGTTYNFE